MLGWFGGGGGRLGVRSRWGGRKLGDRGRWGGG